MCIWSVDAEEEGGKEMQTFNSLFFFFVLWDVLSLLVISESFF